MILRNLCWIVCYGSLISTILTSIQTLSITAYSVKFHVDVFWQSENHFVPYFAKEQFAPHNRLLKFISWLIDSCAAV